MEDKELEKGLEELKKQIPVNEELKQNLRSKFMIRKKNMWIKRITAVAAAIIIVITAVFLPDNFNVKKVKADEIKISNQISYGEISNSNGAEVNEYNGIQYITVYEKGIYRYDNSGYHSVYEGGITSARLSEDGKRFVISANGNLFIYNIETKIKTELIKGDNISIYMEEPAWVDENHILYTKKVIEPVEPHGFSIKEASIYEMDINTLQTVKIADGSYPSYAAGKNAIVFVRDNNVIYRNLKDGSERTVDEGRFPDVSPDGKYIAYVKLESTVKKLNENASVKTSLSNVWITDTEEFKLKQQVTFNFANRYMDENEWLKSLENLKDKSVPQVLEFSGFYDYYNPLWSSSSKSLFVVKFGTGEGESKSKIMRIDFAGEALGRKDTVKRYIQALIARDEDYAKSLMKNPPELLTLSNPHQSGYNILSEGKDEGGNYVEAEVYWQYTGTPYYSIERSRYYLSENEKGYIIDRIKPLSTAELYFKNGSMYLKNDNAEKVLFSEGDIPSDYYKKGESYIQSAAFNEKNNSIVFSLYNDQVSAGSIAIIEYDITAGEFKLIDRLSTIGNENIMGSTDISLDSTGRYAAVNIYYGENGNIKNTIAAYNLDNNQKINIGDIVKGDFDSLYMSFWEDNRLVFTAVKSNEIIKYKYNPENNTLISF